MFFDGFDLKEKKFPSVTATGAKKASAPQSEVTALGGVEAVLSSLEEYFALNASSIERVLQDICGRLKKRPGTYHHGRAGGGVTPATIEN